MSQTNSAHKAHRVLMCALVALGRNYADHAALTDDMPASPLGIASDPLGAFASPTHQAIEFSKSAQTHPASRPMQATRAWIGFLGNFLAVRKPPFTQAQTPRQARRPEKVVARGADGYRLLRTKQGQCPGVSVQRGYPPLRERRYYPRSKESQGHGQKIPGLFCAPRVPVGNPAAGRGCLLTVLTGLPQNAARPR